MGRRKIGPQRNVTLPPYIQKLLEEEAEDRDVSVSLVVREALQMYYGERARKMKKRGKSRGFNEYPRGKRGKRPKKPKDVLRIEREEERRDENDPYETLA